jgi:hypothetical protein
MSELTEWRITGLQALAILFVAVIAIEGGFATSSAINYNQFYKALAQMQVSLASFQVSQGSPGSNVIVIFSVLNPTGYQDMILKDFAISFTVNNSTGSQIQGNTALSALAPSVSLDPMVVRNVTMNFQMQNLQPKNYVFLFTVVIDLSTFLDSLVFLQSAFSCNTSKAEICPIISTTATAVGLFGGGGGGGL